MLCRNPAVNTNGFFDKTFKEYKDGFANDGISSKESCIRHFGKPSKKCLKNMEIFSTQGGGGEGFKSFVMFS